ncbi:MAG: hypothetical protein JST88_09395 [Bacteroidetes bacterium]|nr:hypothetical protein [Bacteroidota bacterium]
MVRDISYFKARFVTGYVITEADIVDWLDSFRPVTVPVVLSDASGLDAILTNYRPKADKVAVSDVDGLLEQVNGMLAGYITTGTPMPMGNVDGLTAALGEKASLAQVQTYVDSLGLQPGTQGASITNVLINENKHLIVTLSNGDVMDAGLLPSAAVQEQHTAYNWQLTGLRDGVNKTFRLGEGQAAWKVGSLRVYRSGQRQTPNGTDYVETEDRKGVTFVSPVLVEENLTFDYEV